MADMPYQVAIYLSSVMVSRYLRCICLLAWVLASPLLAAVASADAPAQSSRSLLPLGTPMTGPSPAGSSDRRLRAEGLAFALGTEVELELWVESRSLADLIADSYATDYRIPRASVSVPDVPYLAAVLSFEGRGFLRFGQINEASPQDYDRISRCLLRPLYSLYPSGLPCDRPDSNCWEDLGERSTALGSRLFPLQLAIFLENAGYSVHIDDLWLPTVVEALETGNMPMATLYMRPSLFLPLPRPERSFTMEDIRLLPCESVAE